MSKIEQSKLKNLPISAQNDEQKEAILSIISNTLTVINGGAGSGKTYLTLGIALEHLVREKIEKIVISRPLVACGRQLGSLPGTVPERCEPYYLPIKYYLNHFLGETLCEKLMKADKIILKPLELMRGANYVDTYLILDEAENASLNQLIMFVSRASGPNSKVILNGDLDQWDISSQRQNKFTTDLQYLVSKCTGLSGFSNIELKQCLRNDFVSRFLRAMKEKD